MAGRISWKYYQPWLTIAICLIEQTAAHLPSPNFHSHRVISPRIYNGRHKRSIETTSSPDEEGGHVNLLTLAWSEEGGEEVVLDLKLNRDLLPESYFERYHHQGQAVVNKPLRGEVELCHYKGKVRGRPSSWAAISTCNGGSIEGILYDGTVMHHIQRVEQTDMAPGINNPHYIYNHDHLKEMNRTCGFSDSQDMNVVDKTTEPFFAEETFNRMLRYKRDISPAQDERAKVNNVNVKGPWNANKRSRYVELVLVVDNRKFKEYGEDLQKVHRKCKDMANIANALYAPLNIYIALVGVDVWSEYDEITLSTNGDTTLTNFLHYRRERLVKQFPNDNAQLLTGIQFDSGVVGKALKGPICTYEFSGGVSMWHSEVIGLVATTMAHELGHNFGMEHDSENCECPDQRCIMAPASSTMRPSFWSTCSLEYLALAFEHGMDYCLRNKPRTLFDSPVCGNGFMEPGEECDCGLKEHCDNPCCNPATCRLFANATCATGECCDFNTCRPKSPGAICRLADHECDLPEYCTGNTEFCPKDIFKVDGESCKVGQSFCYQGSCRTHSDQCRVLWGPSGKKSDNQCYDQNRKGSRHGNCGYNRMNQSYIPCVQDDVRCGMLHCQHLNERLEFGMESVAILSHSFINSGGRIIPCRTALVDLGIDDVDPGLAPEGARCGEGKLCVNQKCMPVASLSIGPQSCVNNCNGHGVCNSLGHCHCDKDWAPPYCESPGAGGSLDSGPASSPDSDSGLATALFIIFLLVIPAILIIVCIAFYVNGDSRGWVKKSQGRDDEFVTVESRATKIRPPSRLNIDSKDISGPVSVEITNSLTSSPTHALLPRSSTQTSDISSQHPSNNGEEPPPDYSTVIGIEKNTSTGSYKSRTSNLLKSSIFKSISFPSSFPSPKFRSSLKSGSDSTHKYEVKIEPRKQEDISPSTDTLGNLESISSPDGAPSAPTEPAVQYTSSVPYTPTLQCVPQATSTQYKPIGQYALPNIKQQTVTNLSNSSSFSNRKPQAKASTLPSSMSLGLVPVEKVETCVVLESQTTQNPPNVDFRNNPKLAFPHSSSFSPPGCLQVELGLPGSLSSGSIISEKKSPILSEASVTSQGWKRPSNPSSYINRNAVAANDVLTKPFTSNIQPLQSRFLTKTPSTTTTSVKSTTVNTLTVSPFSQTPSQLKTTSFSSNKPKPTTSISETKPVCSPTATSVVTVSPSSQTETSTVVTTSIPALPIETLIPSSFIEALPPAEDMNSKNSPTSTSSIISPLKNTNKITTPTAAVRPSISRPMLQNTTPNAASLIAKAPSTGVSQSSILATKKEKETNPFKPPRDKARRAVFCDPITLPSPTSPNNPPIIHQPNPNTEGDQVGKVITPTWSIQPTAVAAQAQVCHIDGHPEKGVTIERKEKNSPTEQAADKSGISKLISSVKRTPSLGVADRGTPKEKDKQSKYNSLPRKPKVDRTSLRNLEISNPILQTEVEYKTDLVPVCGSSGAGNSEATIQSTLAPSTTVANPKENSPSLKRPAPKPPATSSPPSEIKQSIFSAEKGKSKYSLPWRAKPANKLQESPDSPDSTVPKVSSSDDIKGYKKPDVPLGSMRQRRPASIATSKPMRPNAPPPKPPPSRDNSKETSPEDIYIYDDAVALQANRIAPLADIGEDISPCNNEPIYDTIKDVPERGDKVLSEVFSTPAGSPTLPKKSPDTISTGSSAAEEDLMNQILSEMHTKSEGESIYSSLMRKDKKSRKKKAAQQNI